MGKKCLKQRLAEYAYAYPNLDRKLMQFRKNLQEVSDLLNDPDKHKGKHNHH